MKNSRIRFAMLETGVKQDDIAAEYGITQPSVSIVLNRFELAKKEQDEMIRRIREIKEKKDAESEIEAE